VVTVRTYVSLYIAIHLTPPSLRASSRTADHLRQRGYWAVAYPAARDAATDLGREIGEQFLVWLGRQAKEIRAEADAILSARDEDCAALRAMIRDLRDDLADKTAHADRLAEENAALEARLDEAGATIGRLQADLAARDRDEAFKAEVIEMLKDMLARNEEGQAVPR
ncbi:hypothetical protein NHN26_15995, partial [Rhodovulum tesquicola]|uniref:hypothetical protein n=1 Tax=Rhodovulum tesquicola TaxID=540254 RepID=UPI0020978632